MGMVTASATSCLVHRGGPGGGVAGVIREAGDGQPQALVAGEAADHGTGLAGGVGDGSRACFGCYGPQERSNPLSLTKHYARQGIDPGHLVRVARNFNGYAPEFREASNALET